MTTQENTEGNLGCLVSLCWFIILLRLAAWIHEWKGWEGVLNFIFFLFFLFTVGLSTDYYLRKIRR